MYRDLCNLHVRRTACYACIQCALRITRTSRIHHFRSTARMACTARRQLTDMGCACIARSAYAQVEIFPHLQDPIYTQDPTQHSSHTALPDEHCSGRKHLHLSNAAHSCRYCTQPRNACTRCEQWASRRSQGDITGLFDLHSKRSTSANCGMKL